MLVSLGVWQLQRRVAKHALIAALTERLAAAPGRLAAAAHNGRSSRRRRMNSAASALPRATRAGPDAMVYSHRARDPQRRLRPRHLGVPARAARRRRDASWSMPASCRTRLQDRAQQDRAVHAAAHGRAGALTGYLRFPESAGALTPRPMPASGCGSSAIIAAMAQTLGWGEVAPFYIDLEAPVPASGVPKPGPLGRASEGRPSAICHHLVRTGGDGGDRLRRVAGRTAPPTPAASAAIRFLVKRDLSGYGACAAAVRQLKFP